MNSPSSVSLFRIVFSAMSCFALLGVFVPAPSGAASTGEALGFEIITVQKKGIILMVDSGDVNGDGETDMLVFHTPTKEAYEKTCSVHLQKGGTFDVEEDAAIPLGTGTGAVDVEDIDADGIDELCAFDADGMLVHRMDPDLAVAQERVLQCSTLLPPASRRIAAVRWLADINADGRADAVIPVKDGIRVFTHTETGFPELAFFEAPLRARVNGGAGQTYVNYRLPTLTFSDYDDDGHTDICAFDVEQVGFFLTDGEQTPQRRISAPLVRKFTKDFITVAEFRDLNADTVPDAVLVLMSQKKNLESEVRIYFGNPDFSYDSRPAHVYSGTTNLILPAFLDATGDGKMEMLLQNIDVGFTFFLNYFLADRIKVETALHRLTPDGRYGREPAARRSVYVSASESGVEPARGIGDFDGDGCEDLVVGTREDRLSFFLSDAEKPLVARPSAEVAVPAYGTMKTLRLNADNRTDIVIFYPQEEREGTVILLLSS